MGINYYLNEKLFDQIDGYLQNQSEQDDHLLEAFEHIWSYLFQCCQFSMRFLFQTTSRHEYFTFNNLIIDKVDDSLMKLLEKFSFSIFKTGTN